MDEPRWRTSSFTDTGQCVEVVHDGGEIALRNSNRPDAGVIHFTGSEMAAWVAGCKAGEFDDLT